MRIFISYRRSDASAVGLLLATTLKAHFGEENVFFDTRDLELGTQWRREITERVAAADVLLALVGPQWHTLAAERRTDDVLRVEIETALTQGKHVLPVLVDGANPLVREQLPRPFRPLADIQAEELRHTAWERDTAELITKLERLGTRVPPPRTSPPPPPPRDERDGFDEEEQLEDYLRDGSLVIVLGSEINAADRSESGEQAESLPSLQELAAKLASRFKLPPSEHDLAQVSQYVTIKHRGRVELTKALFDLLLKNTTPGPVHRELARLPGLLREQGCDSYPLIVTTNYDYALERAFDEVHEPYDLAVFLTGREQRGRFLHVAWWPLDGVTEKLITTPNGYGEFPIDEARQLERTVIVKIHGGPLDSAGRTGPADNDNFVITEDDYIGYLTPGTAEDFIPTQILGKLRSGHFLFLAHGMRDWNLRVLFQRIWSGWRLPGSSWAVRAHPDPLERRFWDNLGVTFIDESAAVYIQRLARQLAETRGSEIAV